MWKLPALEARTASLAVDADVAFIFQDVGKKPTPPRGHYGPLVERLRKTDSFDARSGLTQFIRFGGKGMAENLLVVGLGASADLTEERARQAGGTAWAKLMAEKVREAAIQLDGLFEAKGLREGASHVRLARAFAEGMILSAYQINHKKSKAASSGKKDADYAGPTKLTFVSQDKNLKKQVERELEQVAAVGESVNLTRDWSNEPSNYGTPQYYAAEAQKLARQHGLKCTILTEKDAAREKMGLYLCVGQGSPREGRIVVLEYAPKGAKNTKNLKTVALVGKGITFDSGGISIKPSARMEEMKHDMTGAATVMGAILLASKWQVQNRVVAILAFTENMPSGDAVQPGNVITGRNGKTVEIVNTDAEGRLILADVLDYAHEFKPDAIVDVATLTGAVGVALGKHCCAILGNNEVLIESIRRAGDSNGERIWQLPLFDEYFEDMKSDYADMRNSANDASGGTIRGAIFLKQFIRKGTQWAHLDIASTAYNVSHHSYYPKKGATGAYVRTLAQFAADF